MMNEEQSFINIIKKRLLIYKELGDKTFLQLEESDFHYKKFETENSVYVIVNHMRGNMLSRFTDFLTTDGEKEWRDRADEFRENNNVDKERIIEKWEEGWNCLMHTLQGLQDKDLSKKITIRGEEHLVVDALLRQVAHYAYHVGQIVYIAKHLKGNDWKSLSIPKEKMVN
ncbi:MAG TPA: DUF1572 family protein [Chitinophagaceae bacterium]|nr:DUF1572 family protein [Chitinophagaceae bacterium]